MKTDITPKLDAMERAEFRKLEDTIQTGLGSFMDVGQALFQIREHHLYRETHKTFEKYCSERWSFSSSRARQLIDSSAVVEDLKSVTKVTLSGKDGEPAPLPTNERQVRPLVGLPPKEQAAVWAEATEKAGGVPSQKIVEQVVAEHAAKATPEKCPTCGATERDEDGDCLKCHEPLGKPEKPDPKPPSKKAKSKKKALDSLGVLIRAMDELGIFTPKWSGVFKELKVAIGHAK